MNSFAQWPKLSLVSDIKRRHLSLYLEQVRIRLQLQVPGGLSL